MGDVRIVMFLFVLIFDAIAMVSLFSIHVSCCLRGSDVSDYCVSLELFGLGAVDYVSSYHKKHVCCLDGWLVGFLRPCNSDDNSTDNTRPATFVRGHSAKRTRSIAHAAKSIRHHIPELHSKLMETTANFFFHVEVVPE
jgi:hypothetical protein